MESFEIKRHTHYPIPLSALREYTHSSTERERFGKKMSQSSERSKWVSLCVLLFAYFASTIIAEDGMFSLLLLLCPQMFLVPIFSAISFNVLFVDITLLFCGYALWVLDHLVISEIWYMFAMLLLTSTSTVLQRGSIINRSTRQ